MSKKYYWMKLKEDFFDDDAIEWLEDQPKGKEYTLFYLKLCLKSLKTNGILIREVGTLLVPYDTKKLSEVTKTDFDTVVVAMELLKSIGLVEILEYGEICIPHMEELVGSETDKAAIMRRLREQKKALGCSNDAGAPPSSSQCGDGNNVTQVLPGSYPCGPGNNVTGQLPDSYQNVTQRLENRDRDKDINIIVAPLADSPRKDSGKGSLGEFEYQCVEMLAQSCVSLFPNSKVPRTAEEKRKWAAEIERMKRLDGRVEADIIEALTYATTDVFWKANIRSAKKFREKFETLIVQSRAKGAGGGNPKKANSFSRFPQRSYDMDSLEAQLLGAGGVFAGEGAGLQPPEKQRGKGTCT